MSRKNPADPPDLSHPYDCVIVGGGPAGLTCGLFLARSRRRVLVVDSGHPRNYASRGIHGFLGQHGILPADLLERGRNEAAASGVEFLFTKARQARAVEKGFEVVTDASAVQGRKLVLAYGVRDVLPDVPEIERFYGSAVFHCPDCDGCEVSDKRVGVVGCGKKVVGLTLRLREWTKDLTVLTNGVEPEIEPPELARLEKEKIPIRAQRMKRLITEGQSIRAVEFVGGEQLALDALFFNIGVHRSCDLAEQLGCRLCEIPPHLDVNQQKETTVDGVYAVGDLVAGAQLAVTSAADGAIAAISINKALCPSNWLM